MHIHMCKHAVQITHAPTTATLFAVANVLTAMAEVTSHGKTTYFGLIKTSEQNTKLWWRGLQDFQNKREEIDIAENWDIPGPDYTQKCL